jgi:chorismate mutase/prephenate dehydratase
MSRENLEVLRSRIDRIDERILELLNERMEASTEIGSIKWSQDQDVVDNEREEAILRRLSSLNSGPLPEKTLRAVYREIFSGSRALQHPLTVAFLGPLGTYSHEAALGRFGASASYLPCHTVGDVFQEVLQGAVTFGVAPVENSIEGSVRETLDLLMTSPVGVCGEIPLKITHALMNLTGRPEDIRTIASHPQALAQCRQWLMGRFPGIPLLETSSTAQAAQRASEDTGLAAIGNERLASILGLKIIRRGIQDKMSNITRFLLLGHAKPAPTGEDKTALVFWTEDRPGALYRILEQFARHGVNLSRIESRPDRGDMPWKYAFFVDLEGHREDLTIQHCLQELSGRETVVKVLGSFPRSQLPSGE